MDDLIERVHPRVGASGTHDQWFMVEAKRLGERGAKEPHDRVVLRLVRESTEGLTVVGQVEAPTLRDA